MRLLIPCLLAACASSTPSAPAAPAPPALAAWHKPEEPPPVIKATAKDTLLITNAKIHTIAGTPIAKGYVLVATGRIKEVGEGEKSVAGARVIDASNREVTPGLIDTHSHLGVYAWPEAQAHED